MKKILKNLVTAMLVVCSVVCLGLFAAACVEPEPSVDTDKYTVTVKLPDGSPAAGVHVQLCCLDGSTLSCLDQNTESNGEAVFDISSFADTTGYSIHLPGLSAEYSFADANGTPYGDDGLKVYVKDGYSVTINLVAATPVEQVPADITLNVVLPTAGSTSKQTPAIEKDGLYELSSETEFTVSGTGYTLNDVDGYKKVYLDLKKGDSFDIGSIDTTRTLSLTLKYCVNDGSSADKAFTVTGACTVVLNLAANEVFNVKTAESTSKFAVNGANFKAAYENADHVNGVTLDGNKTASLTATDASKLVVFEVSEQAENAKAIKVKPVDGAFKYTTFISQSGWYKINSSVEDDGFAMSGNGFSYTEKTHNALIYLNNNETLTFYVDKNTDFGIRHQTFENTQASPLVLSDDETVVLNNSATTYYVKNPESNDKGAAGSQMAVDGNNFTATYNDATKNSAFIVEVGDTFTVTATDNTKPAILNVQAYFLVGTEENPLELTLGESQNLKITLEMEGDDPDWSFIVWGDNLSQGIYVVFTTTDAGYYTLSFQGEGLSEDDSFGAANLTDENDYIYSVPVSFDTDTSVISTTMELKANTTYRFVLTSMCDFPDHNVGDVLTYSIKVCPTPAENIPNEDTDE